MPMPVVARHKGFLGIVTPVKTPHICVLRNGPYPSPPTVHEKVHEKFTIFLSDIKYHPMAGWPKHAHQP